MKAAIDISIEMEVRVQELMIAHGYAFKPEEYFDMEEFLAFRETLGVWLEGMQQSAWQFLAGGISSEDFNDELLTAFSELYALFLEDGFPVGHLHEELPDLYDEFIRDLKIWRNSNYAVTLCKKDIDK